MTTGPAGRTHAECVLATPYVINDEEESLDERFVRMEAKLDELLAFAEEVRTTVRALTDKFAANPMLRMMLGGRGDGK